MDGDDRRRAILAVVVIGLAYLAVTSGVLTRSTVVLMAVLIPSVIVHEVSHGALAYLFGDDTAKRAGRLTLNPLPHVDPFGTVVLPGILALVGAPPFGYAKPVPVTPRKLRHPRNQSLLVSLVGPATNIVLAAVSLVGVRLALDGFDIGRWAFDPSGVPITHDLLLSFGLVNVVLAAFNLIPIPPLDGSAVVERVLPARWWEPYLRFRQYSMLLLMALIFVVPSGIGIFTNPAIDLWARLLT